MQQHRTADAVVAHIAAACMAGVMHAALPAPVYPSMFNHIQIPNSIPAHTQHASSHPLPSVHSLLHTPHPPQAAPTAKPQAIFRKDYTPPPYLVDTVHLNFNLNEDVTHVTSKLALKPNYTPNGSRPALTLNGRPDVKLVEVRLAGGWVLGGGC